jgi:hypothetical protein
VGRDRFADVGPNLQRLKIVHHLPAVIALVGHDFLDASHGVVCDGTSRVELLSRFGQRLLNRWFRPPLSGMPMTPTGVRGT